MLINSQQYMKIGIIGAGNVGTGLAKLLTIKGHEIMFSFSKHIDKLAQTAKSFGARSGSVAEAVSFADVVVIATPWVATKDALAQAGKPVGKKFVWDCTNALKPDMSGLAIGTTTSAAEEIQKAAPWARVVKAIPPFAELMHTGSVQIGGKTAGIFVASDDAEAKRMVMLLVQDLGAEPTDAGPLSNARYIEPAAFLLVQLAYMQGFGAKIALTLLR
jgi:8-hydroxy-5-deazaflavin:NADPH oxidoreductase